MDLEKCCVFHVPLISASGYKCHILTPECNLFKLELQTRLKCLVLSLSTYPSHYSLYNLRSSFLIHLQHFMRWTRMHQWNPKFKLCA